MKGGGREGGGRGGWERGRAEFPFVSDMVRFSELAFMFDSTWLSNA